MRMFVCMCVCVCECPCVCAAESTEVAYQEVKEVVVVSRLGGLFGDMVVTLNNGDKIELRSLEK